MTRLSSVAAVLTCLGLLAPVSSAQDEVYWNQFRGPNGDGESIAKNLPVEFSETKNVHWKTPIPGVGWSSPVVWRDQVWLTTGTGGGDEFLRAAAKRDAEGSQKEEADGDKIEELVAGTSLPL